MVRWRFTGHRQRMRHAPVLAVQPPRRLWHGGSSVLPAQFLLMPLHNIAEPLLSSTQSVPRLSQGATLGYWCGHYIMGSMPLGPGLSAGHD
jgi:hypothetical protein